MASVGLVSLAANFANPQDSTDAVALQGLAQPQSNAQAISGGSSQAATGAAQDQFTPSAATTTLDSTAVAAGLFAANQVNPFTVAGESLLASNAALQPETPPANNTALANPAGQASNDPGNAAAPQTAAPATPPPVSPTAIAAATSAQTASSAVRIEEQLQALNNSLAALGVNADGLRQIDQIASRLNDFSPTAFTSLAYELVALSQQVAPPPTTNAPNVAGAAAGSANTPVNGAANAATA